MTDPEIIYQGYEATISQLYQVLYHNLSIAQDDTERELAESRFQAGIRVARDIHNHAKQLLQ